MAVFALVVAVTAWPVDLHGGHGGEIIVEGAIRSLIRSPENEEMSILRG